MKRFFALLFFGLLAFSGVRVSAEEAHTQKLRWMGHWKGEGLREQLVREVLNDFTFVNQDIDVEFAFAADVLQKKNSVTDAEFIAHMIQSGDIAWDVIWIDNFIYKRVGDLLQDPDWGRKYLVDFSTVPGFSKTQKLFLVEGPHCHRQTSGVFIGPYIEGFVYALWYNKEVADQLGLEIKEKDMLFTDMMDYVRAVDEYNRTTDKPITAFVDFRHSGSIMRLAYNLYVSSSRPTDTEKIIQVLNAIQQLSKLNPVGREDTTNWHDAAQILKENRALFLVDPLWRYNLIQAECPQLLNKMYLAQPPGFQEQKYYVGEFMPVWAVMKHSPGREAGIRLMQFWSRPEIAEKWVRYTKSPTGLAGNFYDPAYGQDRLACYQQMLTAGRTMVPDIFSMEGKSCPLYRFLNDLNPLIRGELTPEEILNSLPEKSE